MIFRPDLWPWLCFFQAFLLEALPLSSPDVTSVLQFHVLIDCKPCWPVPNSQLLPEFLSLTLHSVFHLPCAVCDLCVLVSWPGANPSLYCVPQTRDPSPLQSLSAEHKRYTRVCFVSSVPSLYVSLFSLLFLCFFHLDPLLRRFVDRLSPTTTGLAVLRILPLYLLQCFLVV